MLLLSRNTFFLTKILWTLMRLTIALLQTGLSFLNGSPELGFNSTFAFYNGILGLVTILLLIAEQYFPGSKMKKIFLTGIMTDLLLTTIFLFYLFAWPVIAIITIALILIQALLIRNIIKIVRVKEED